MLVGPQIACDLAIPNGVAQQGGVLGGVILNQSAHNAAPTQLLYLDQRLLYLGERVEVRRVVPRPPGAGQASQLRRSAIVPVVEPGESKGSPSLTIWRRGSPLQHVSLHDHGHVDLPVVNVVPQPVGHGPLGEQRSLAPAPAGTSSRRYAPAMTSPSDVSTRGGVSA